MTSLIRSLAVLIPAAVLFLPISSSGASFWDSFSTSSDSGSLAAWSGNSSVTTTAVSTSSSASGNSSFWASFNTMPAMDADPVAPPSNSGGGVDLPFRPEPSTPTKPVDGAVPEPTAALLFAAGFAVVASRTRRR